VKGEIISDESQHDKMRGGRAERDEWRNCVLKHKNSSQVSFFEPKNLDLIRQRSQAQ